MKFIPFNDKIEIEPIKSNTIILHEGNNFEEKGKVISVGKDVTFVKPGDIVYFSDHGCFKTATEEGKSRYVVSVNEEVILGKYVEDNE